MCIFKFLAYNTLQGANMWELSINLADKNVKIAKKIYIILKDFCKNYGGIVTTYERFMDDLKEIEKEKL